MVPGSFPAAGRLAVPRRAWNTPPVMHEPALLDTPQAELTEFPALHRATAWLDALAVDLAGMARHERDPREDFAPLFDGGMQFPLSTHSLDLA